VTVFVDTSAFYALLSTRDANHDSARRAFDVLLDRDVLVTTNYVLVESISLVRHRHGRRPLRALRALFDVCERIWVDGEVHDAAFDRLTRGGRGGASFVDLVSFAVMRDHEIAVAFAYDDDFRREGFSLVAE